MKFFHPRCTVEQFAKHTTRQSSKERREHKLKNILLLTANTGGGHNTAANALKNYIDKNEYNMNISVVEYFKYINPKLSKLTSVTYEVFTKNMPSLYKASYNIRNLIPNKDSNFSKALFNTRSTALIEEYKPDIVVCIHPFIVSEIMEVKKINNYKFSVFVLMTDFNFHEGWVYPGVDRYIVSNDFMRLKLMKKNVLKNKIHCFGIPTSDKFNLKLDKKQARIELGLKNMTTVLIIGGSFGAGKIQKVFEELASSNLDIQLVIIAGRDQNLKKDLLKLTNKYDKIVQVLGYTDKLSLYMDAVDILITKPGGLTLTEAMIKELPMIVVNPIPGQEEENETFLLNKGIAVSALNKNISIVLADLLEDSNRIKNMKLMSSIYAKPNASKDISYLLTNYNENAAVQVAY